MASPSHRSRSRGRSPPRPPRPGTPTPATRSWSPPMPPAIARPRWPGSGLSTTTPSAPGSRAWPAGLRGVLLAALMMHTDRRLLERQAPDTPETTPACESAHMDPAWRTAQHLMLHVDGTAFARRWLIAMTLQDRWDGCFQDALRWIDAAARWFPTDPEVLLTRGTLHETVAVLPSPLPRPFAVATKRSQQAIFAANAERTHLLNEARRSLERALAVDPALDLARLRLGRVLWRLGKGDEARRALEGVLARSDDDADAPSRAPVHRTRAPGRRARRRGAPRVPRRPRAPAHLPARRDRLVRRPPAGRRGGGGAGHRRTDPGRGRPAPRSPVGLGVRVRERAAALPSSWTACARTSGGDRARGAAGGRAGRIPRERERRAAGARLSGGSRERLRRRLRHPWRGAGARPRRVALRARGRRPAAAAGAAGRGVGAPDHAPRLRHQRQRARREAPGPARGRGGLPRGPSPRGRGRPPRLLRGGAMARAALRGQGDRSAAPWPD